MFFVFVHSFSLANILKKKYFGGGTLSMSLPTSLLNHPRKEVTRMHTHIKYKNTHINIKMHTKCIDQHPLIHMHTQHTNKLHSFSPVIPISPHTHHHTTHHTPPHTTTHHHTPPHTTNTNTNTTNRMSGDG